MNINIHGQNTFVRNLGLIRITGSFTSEAALSTMEKHLQNYGIEMASHIFAITADGAAVMKKCGRISGATYQGCYSHALHLAVCDILYKKNMTTTRGEESDDVEQEEEDGEEEEMHACENEETDDPMRKQP